MLPRADDTCPAIIKSQAPSVGINILPFEETPPEEVIDRLEVDMVILPEPYLTPDHPSEELFRDTYTCIAWKGNKEIGKSLTPRGVLYQAPCCNSFYLTAAGHP